MKKVMWLLVLPLLVLFLTGCTKENTDVVDENSISNFPVSSFLDEVNSRNNARNLALIPELSTEDDSYVAPLTSSLKLTIIPTNYTGNQASDKIAKLEISYDRNDQVAVSSLALAKDYFTSLLEVVLVDYSEDALYKILNNLVVGGDDYLVDDILIRMTEEDNLCKLQILKA